MSRVFVSFLALAILPFLFVVLMTGGCTSLPKEVQRTPAYALEDSADTTLYTGIQPLVEAHDRLSGFYALSEGMEAFVVRLYLVERA